ncbi:MAG TPA: hypothetical protein VMS73_07990 [Anaerolineaceae bacterium]|nr:hypothetical protein [Anaerolineaceae bacterium]
MPIVNSSLLTPDNAPENAWQGAPPLGSKAPDAPCACYSGSDCQPIFLRALPGSGFGALYFAASAAEGQPFSQAECSSLPGIPVRVSAVVAPHRSFQGSSLVDEAGALHKAFAAQPGTLYLIRPDGHISARRRSALPSDLPSLLCKACGLSE